MADSLILDIRKRVDSFLAGESSFVELQDWLVGRTWDIEERGDPKAVDLTYEIKLAFAEHSRGDISMNELRSRLKEGVEAAVSAGLAGQMS